MITPPEELYLNVWLIQPNGGEKIRDEEYEITWKLDTNIEDSVDISLYFSPDAGNSWVLIDAGEFNESYTWDLSDMLRGNDYKVKIVASYITMEHNLTAQDVSADTF